MHIYDKDDKLVRQVFPVPDYVTNELEYSNLTQEQKANVIRYRFGLSHGKGKRKKKRKK